MGKLVAVHMVCDHCDVPFFYFEKFSFMDTVV